MKEYTQQAKQFYNSKAWKRTRRLYLLSVNFICERCGKPADVVHHKNYINLENINDFNTLLSFDNLEALCMDCHNKEHFKSGREKKYIFDEMGNLVFMPPTSGGI